MDIPNSFWYSSGSSLPIVAMNVSEETFYLIYKIITVKYISKYQNNLDKNILKKYILTYITEPNIRIDLLM